MKNLNDYGFNTKNKTYIIAEIGINHGGDLECAKELIQSAAQTGADAVKFQTYLTEKRAPAGNQEVFDIFKKCELSLESFEELKKLSDSLDVDFFSTAFDKESLNFLESINCPMYKIASFDVVNKELIRRISETKKPVIMSVGMSSLEEIKKSYELLKENCEQISLLHCISAYPTDPKDANLSAISTLKNNFDCVIGQSDHTNDIKVPLFAVAAGAQILEKHYKISDDMPCIDAPVSISQTKMTQLVENVRELEVIMGNPSVALRKAEEPIVPFRRFS